MPAPVPCDVIVTHITTKEDLSRWTRAHASTPGITWTTSAGPGGTMVITMRAAQQPK